MLTFRFTGADGVMTVYETLTSGMVGKEAKLEFSSDWDNLTKTAVFMAGSVTRDVVGVSDVVTIPAEVLAVPMKRLYVGVYGVSGGGKVTPTIRAQGPIIQPGADPSGDEGTDPDLPVWAELDQRMTNLEENGTGKNGICILGEGETVDDAPAGATIIIDPNAETDEPATQKWVTEQIEQVKQDMPKTDGLASETWVTAQINQVKQDMPNTNGLASETWVTSQIQATVNATWEASY